MLATPVAYSHASWCRNCGVRAYQLIFAEAKIRVRPKKLTDAGAMVELK